MTQGDKIGARRSPAQLLGHPLLSPERSGLSVDAGLVHPHQAISAKEVLGRYPFPFRLYPFTFVRELDVAGGVT